MRYLFERALLLVLLLVLLLTSGARLLVAGAHNLATAALVPALTGVTNQPTLPECGEQGDVDAAARWLAAGQALGAAPNERALLIRGWTAWVRGNCAYAEATWKQACTEEASGGVAPSCFRLFLRSGGQLGSLPQDSINVESMAEYAYRFGTWAERDEAESKAVFAYELSFDLEPNRDAAEKLTRLYRQADRTDDAVAVWEHLAAALPPGDADHWWALGQAAGLRGDWQRAAIAYGRGGASVRAPYDFWIQQGVAYGHAEQWDKAEEAFFRALSENPDRAGAYLGLGHLSLRAQDFPRALEWYLAARAAAPDSYDALYYVGLTHYRQGRDDLAITWLTAACQVESRRPLCHYYLAQALYRTGEREKAVQFLARAVRLHSREPWDWALQLARWHVAMGDRQEALAAYRQALAWKPESIEIRELEVVDQ